MKHGGASELLPGDNPILDSTADLLGRAGIAESFAGQVLALDASEGAAVGVFGPWGSGKTSFINLARRTFESEDVPVLDFNPWMFSGAEQLVGRFFSELSAEMGEENGLSEIGEAFRKFGAAFNAVAGVASALLAVPQIGEIVKNITEAANATAHPESIVALRKKIESTLRQRDSRVIVFLDDVDRLSGPEIREVFKLVRLTASFPNLVYIVACDRRRVEKALKERGLPGRDYLEKIIQFPFNLPETPRSAIREEAHAAIDSIKTRGPFDVGRHSDIFLRIVEPLLQTMRDIRRYEIAVRSATENLEGRVELADVFGLEAVRLFLPDVFRRVHGAVDILTVTSDNKLIERESKKYGILTSGDLIPREDLDNPDSPSGTWLDEWSKDAGPHRQVVRNMIDILFPAAAKEPGMTPEDPGGLTEELLQKRRVGHEDVLRFYLERVAGGDLRALEDAKEALNLMMDFDRFDNFMRSRKPEERLEIIRHLPKFRDEFVQEHVEPGLVAILNLLPDCPSDDLRSFRLSIRSVVSGLLSKLSMGGALEETVTRIRTQLASPESKYELIIPLVCKGLKYSINPNLEILTEKFKTEMCDWIRDDLYSDRIEDQLLASFIFFLVDFGKKPVKIPNDPKKTFCIFWSCSNFQLAEIPLVYWNSLLKIYGDEAILCDRMDDLRKNLDGLGSFLEFRNISTEEASQLLDRADEGRKQKAG